MKGFADSQPFLMSLSAVHRSLLERLLEAIHSEYPRLKSEREGHQRLHDSVRQLESQSLHLSTEQKLEYIENSISSLNDYKAELADQRVRMLFNEAYEQLEIMSANNKGIRSPQKILEIAGFSKVLAKISLLWATILLAEAEIFVSEQNSHAIQEFEAARELTLDLLGQEHPLYLSLCKAHAELLQ